MIPELNEWGEPVSDNCAVDDHALCTDKYCKCPCHVLSASEEKKRIDTLYNQVLGNINLSIPKKII